MLCEPTESSFDYPALAQHTEATPPTLISLDQLQAQCAGFAMGSHPGCKVRSSVSLVGPQAAQPPESVQCFTQKATRPLALGHIGSGDANLQQQPQGIDQDMTLNPLGFLGCIVASLPSLVSRADRLTVQSGRRGLHAFAHRLTPQIVDNLPASLLGPLPKVIVNSLPRAKVSGKQPPRATRAHKVEQHVANANA